MSVISVITEYTVVSAACQALFTCLLSGLSRFSPCCYRVSRSLRKALEMLLRLMRQNKANTAPWLAALLVCLFGCLAAGAASEDLADDASLCAAICPVVYQLAQSPSSHGYHYSFFGNAFFINEQGCLLTVAHVLETFRDGGQPYILVSRPNSPPRLLQAAIIAVDSEHDVAVLLATPNPFAGNHKVAFLPLASDPAFRGQAVIALSLHPPRLQNAHTFQAPQEDRSSGEVLALDSRAVVGLVEGRWLRSSTISIAKSSSRSISTPGAAIPIRHAIALLQRQSISWHTPQSPPSSLPTR